MTDACLSGYAVGEAVWNIQHVRMVRERDGTWRFKDKRFETSGHREGALSEYRDRMLELAEADEFRDLISVESPACDLVRNLDEYVAFPNMFVTLLQPNGW